jgi:transposase
MDDLIKLMDKNLDYVSHQIRDNVIYICVVSNRLEVICPICGTPSKRCHSKYTRSFNDLPIQGKEVIIQLQNRKMFCDHENCLRTTFAETFTSLPFKAKKTQRLLNEILNVASTQSSIQASKTLKASGISIKKAPYVVT